MPAHAARTAGPSAVSARCCRCGSLSPIGSAEPHPTGAGSGGVSSVRIAGVFPPPSTSCRSATRRGIVRPNAGVFPFPSSSGLLAQRPNVQIGSVCRRLAGSASSSCWMRDGSSILRPVGPRFLSQPGGHSSDNSSTVKNGLHHAIRRPTSGWKMHKRNQRSAFAER
jgi:hypothetical protein